MYYNKKRLDKLIFQETLKVLAEQTDEYGMDWPARKSALPRARRAAAAAAEKANPWAGINPAAEEALNPRTARAAAEAAEDFAPGVAGFLKKQRRGIGTQVGRELVDGRWIDAEKVAVRQGAKLFLQQTAANGDQAFVQWLNPQRINIADLAPAEREALEKLFVEQVTEEAVGVKTGGRKYKVGPKTIAGGSELAVDGALKAGAREALETGVAKGAAKKSLQAIVRLGARAGSGPLGWLSLGAYAGYGLYPSLGGSNPMGWFGDPPITPEEYQSMGEYGIMGKTDPWYDILGVTGKGGIPDLIRYGTGPGASGEVQFSGGPGGGMVRYNDTVLWNPHVSVEQNLKVGRRLDHAKDLNIISWSEFKKFEELAKKVAGADYKKPKTQWGSKGVGINGYVSADLDPNYAGKIMGPELRDAWGYNIKNDLSSKEFAHAFAKAAPTIKQTDGTERKWDWKTDLPEKYDPEQWLGPTAAAQMRGDLPGFAGINRGSCEACHQPAQNLPASGTPYWTESELAKSWASPEALEAHTEAIPQWDLHGWDEPEKYGDPSVGFPKLSDADLDLSMKSFESFEDKAPPVSPESTAAAVDWKSAMEDAAEKRRREEDARINDPNYNPGQQFKQRQDVYRPRKEDGYPLRESLETKRWGLLAGLTKK